MLILPFRHYGFDVHEETNFETFFKFRCIMLIYAWFPMHCTNRNNNSLTNHVLIVVILFRIQTITNNIDNTNENSTTNWRSMTLMILSEVSRETSGSTDWQPNVVILCNLSRAYGMLWRKIIDYLMRKQIKSPCIVMEDVNTFHSVKWRHMAFQNLFKIGSGTGLLPDDTDPFPEYVLTKCQ